MTEAGDAFAGLQALFFARLADDRGPLREAAANGEYPTVRMLTHRISGAGALLGFTGISAMACQLEEAVDSHLPAAALSPMIGQLIAGIDTLLDNRHR